MTDVSIMPLPHNYAFVTFDSVEGVDKALAETRISIFGQRYCAISYFILFSDLLLTFVPYFVY